MTEETKRCFAGDTTRDAVEVGAMFDMVLEEVERVTDRLDLIVRGLLANAVITREWTKDPVGVVEHVNRIYQELAINPPGVGAELETPIPLVQSTDDV